MIEPTVIRRGLQQGRGSLPAAAAVARRSSRSAAHGRSGVGRAWRRPPGGTGAPTTARRDDLLDGDPPGAPHRGDAVVTRAWTSSVLRWVSLAATVEPRADDAQLVTVDQEVPFVDLAVGDAGVVQPADEPLAQGDGRSRRTPARRRPRRRRTRRATSSSTVAPA